MRVLKVVQAYYPFQDKGGPVVKVRAIAQGLAAKGQSVTVLTADHGFSSRFPFGFAIEKGKWGRRAQENGVTAIYLRSVVHYRSLTFNPSVIGFAAGSITQFDLAHIYGLYDLLGPIVAFYCRRHGIPYFVEPMGMYRPIVRNLRLKRMYHRALGNRLLSAAYQLVATSEMEKQELVGRGVDTERITIRRNGINAPASLPARGLFRKQWGIEPDARVVLYLGRLVSKKSPDMLIDAFARWRRESRNWDHSVLVLAGPEESDGYSARLRSQASAAGIAANVIFTGPLYDEAKWAAFRDADVFALPSQNENFGNSAAEAIACGTPVIVTDQCGIAPIIAEKAGLVVKHDSTSLANALRLLLGDVDLAAQFRANCGETAAGLTWEAPLEQMEVLYREAIAGSRRSEMEFQGQTT